MLYSAIIKAPETEHCAVDNNWEFYTNDDKHYSYMENLSIKQRIFQGKYATVEYINEIQDDEHGDMLKGYDVGEYQFVNNGRNMGLSIMDFSKSKNQSGGKFENALFITLCNDGYKLLRYNIYNRENKDIIQTFKNRGVYQGCVIGFNKNPMGESEEENVDTTIFDLEVKNTVTNQYNIIKFRYEYDDVFMEITDKISSQKLKELRTIEEKYKQHNLHFKMTCNVNKFITNTYIVNKKDVDKVTAILNDNLNQNYKMIVVQDGELDYLSDSSEDAKSTRIHKIMEDVFLNDRIRAVTIVDLDVPRNFCNYYRILYLFKHDTETGKTFCLRSN